MTTQPQPNRLALIRRTIAVSLLSASAISWAGPPEFRLGEILVNGSPDQHPSLNTVRYYPLSDVSLVSVEPGQEHATITKLQAKGKKASVNLAATKFMPTNDPYRSYQWHFNSINLSAAHDTTTGTGAVVAVLDTGFNSGGADSVSCLTAGTDIVNNDNDPTDGDGHGTHVSGTIAQASDNGVGVAGIAYNSCLMAVKVLSDSGSGSFVDIAEGIRWATDHGANVINMSLGISAQYQITNDPVTDAALDYAYINGVTVVAAAGNDGFRKMVSYPAVYPTVIAVGATDYRDQKVRYSNFGTGLDVMAPGGDTSADRNRDGYVDGVLQETFDSNGVFGYWFYQGTSMASPHVAGVAALLVASGVATTPDDVRAALTSTAKDLGEAGYDDQYGHGLIQADAALTWVPGEPPVEEPPVDPPLACTDADGDGYCEEIDDCDDTDPKVNPGMNEKGPRRNDGIDNDCDGVIDPQSR
ncbi:S8 family serine peptidase [Litoribrevibacter albus]|uniref:Peptidase S8/S53 domain-containing protein n=1 Tax=Litoribrevibacter albus TaxID=1473156 RepID=A0AA37W4F0_9GAMM|nr:S8 family serine peptidase [Litoribrevibacter albus]GLQ30027.1 hypothetical protein GCM10007876_05050 [Litoribrevibacter albus]